MDATTINNKEPTMPTNAELWEEIQSVRAMFNGAISRQAESNAALALGLAENTAATRAMAKDVSDVKSILQIGRALGMVAGGARWVVVWVTPIVAFVFGIWQFVLWLMGKGPFPHS